jgi:hypothetical protein
VAIAPPSTNPTNKTGSSGSQARVASFPSSGVTTGRGHAPAFFIVFHCSLHCFSIDTHCSCAGGVSLAFAEPYIADGVDFPLQIDCIFSAASS